MNDKQKVIRATFVTLLLIAIVFYVPWKRNDTNDIRWAPFYQNPITYISTFDGSAVTNRFSEMRGQRMYGLYVLQIIGLSLAGVILFRKARDE